MATIIKSRSSRTDGAKSVQPVAFSFADMSGRAEDYLESVRDAAARIVAEANKEAETIRRQAEESGRQAAEDAIERILDEKVAGQMQTLRPAIENVVRELVDARGVWQEYWQRSALRIATQIAERIIRREIKNEPQITLDLVREALEMAADNGKVAIHLNPQDHQSLGKQAEALSESIAGLGPAKVVADESVTTGGCKVVSQFGEIDQQIESQLARIEAELA